MTAERERCINPLVLVAAGSRSLSVVLNFKERE
jgi:hypothetical protein